MSKSYYNLGKKGEEKTLGLLYEIIAIIAVVILLILVFTSLAKRADESTQDTLCRASVILRGKASIALVDGLVEFEKITPLACHTKNLETLDGTREEVKDEIAKYSAKCWWQFAEGSVADIFKVDRKEKACFTCYTFTIEDDLDKGASSTIKIFNEPEPDVSMRTDTISSYEMTNFLVSEAYNPGIIYGGGTKNYFGTSYVYDSEFKFTNEPRVIKPSKISSTLVSGYVMDYSYMISDDAKNKINEIGVSLQQADIGNLLIVVADEFKSIEPSDARRIIENTKLNTNDTNYDAILVMLDIKSQTMRIQLGSDQSIFIKDYELNDIMVEAFKNAKEKCGEDAKCTIEDALVNSIDEVSSKLLNEANTLPGISPKSYYYYITNKGYTWTMISDIEPQRTYAITYVAASDEKSFWTGTGAARNIGAGVGATVVGFALTFTGVGAPVGLMLISAGAIGGMVGGTEAAKLWDGTNPQIRPNNIMIVPVDKLGDQCTILK